MIQKTGFQQRYHLSQPCLFGKDSGGITTLMEDAHFSVLDSEQLKSKPISAILILLMIWADHSAHTADQLSKGLC